MSRLANHAHSLQTLKVLLHEVITSPTQFLINEDLRKALSSQGALAKFSDSARGIYPMALNTLKRRCADTSPECFTELEVLRKRALTALQKQLQKTSPPPRNRKSELTAKNEELRQKNQSLKEDLLKLTMLFERSLQQGLYYAENSKPVIIALCKKEQKELLALFNHRKRLTNDE